ncbi:MAG: Ig-like domain-containing protein [Muribaculaceae bacterium]|nr:Ig-like domain-containing protein [Muribaculaceae bacterium]
MEKSFKYFVFALLGLLLYSCASIGRPTGGVQDMLAPVFVKSNPAPEAKNVTGNKVEIEFDELVQLKDQQDKVVISPVQKEPATVKAQGRKIVIEFKDTLLDNTTYSIDFADAIQDVNEGNPIEGFSYAFSTGDMIDSLQISGILLDSRTLEPQQKMLVGVHMNLDDTAFYKVPLLRISRTNGYGQFTIRNLKAGKYNLFAINDVDRDNKFANPTEDIAFYGVPIEPSATSEMKPDSIFTAEHRLDTVIIAPHTHYLPNDILLSMFNENRKSQYLVKDERPDSNKFYLEFAAPADTLPQIKLLDYEPEKKDWYKINRSMTNDTITYWITDRAMLKMDTVKVEAKFMRSDTLQNLVQGTDTLLFKLKKSKAIKKKKNKEKEDSLPKIEFIKYAITTGNTQEVNAPIRFKFEIPLDSINQEGLHLYIKKDSLWEKTADAILLNRDNDYNLHNYNIEYAWEPGASYKLLIDSLAITDIYGLFNKPIESEITVKQLEEYSDLFFTINVRDSAFVELLGSDDKVQRTAPILNGTAEFQYLNPGTYYARLVIDRNGNGKYDTGNYEKKIQPEDVYYYPKKLSLKKNWEVTENWDINAMPVDKQKLEVIKKNKPTAKKWEDKTKKKKKDNGEDEDEVEENSFGTNQFQDSKNPFSNQR